MKIGIDFGSTYSTISAYNSNTDQVEPLKLMEGEPESIPSVVSISHKGKVSTGKAAKELVGRRGIQVYEAFKMLLNEPNKEMLARRGYDSERSPREIARIYLQSCLRGIVNRYNCSSLEEVFICVPEIWGKNVRTLDGRSILREILKNELDLPVGHVQVVTEPEAASAFFAYNYEKETKKSFNGHILMVDYGGGTLDLTLTQVTSNGQGTMEIAYREGGGAGENHPDAEGTGSIGSAGIAYMQGVVELAMRDEGLLGPDEHPDYTDPDFVAAVRDLETQLKSAERMKEIEDTFGSYGSYFDDIAEILEEEPMEFWSLQLGYEDLPVTFQQLYTAYRDIIAPVLEREIRSINEKTKARIGIDPTQSMEGRDDIFKIALVGGFGSFYLVNRQIADIYHLDPNSSVDPKVKNIPTDKRELAISLGAALLAAGRVVLHKTARYSIGLYTGVDETTRCLHYGIKYHQTVVTGRPYFICRTDAPDDSPANRITFGGLHGNISHFAIEFTDMLNHGGLMSLKPEIRAKLDKLPQEGFWHCGFSLDESDIVSFHVVPRPLPGITPTSNGIVIPLESYTNLFDLTAVTEVTT